MVTVSLQGGGTEKVVSLLATHFSQEYLTSIITLVNVAPFYDLASSVNVLSPSKRLGRSKFVRTFQQFWHAFKSLREFRPDVCIIFGEEIAGLLCPIARLAGASRVFVSNRGTPGRSLRGVLRYLNPISYRLAECVIVQTNQASQTLKSTYRKCRFKVIANPISIPGSVPMIGSRKKQIIYVASLGRDKNQIGLIRVFSSLNSTNDWKLVFVGDGPDRMRLETLVRQTGMENKIDFLGQRTDVAGLLQESQIFAFPSLSEGFPNALAEALAAGCACISYDCLTGPRDLVSDGVNGMLIPVGNETLFSENLQTLIDHERLRIAFSEKARSMIRQYEASTIIAKFRQLISPDT